MLKSRCFYCMYKTREQELLIDNKNNLSKFKFLKKTPLFFSADPFPINVDGRDYVFAELINKFTSKGHLAYLCLQDKRPKWKTVLKTKNHKSFPNVFKCEKEIYMIPETYKEHAVSLYKCICFPNQWKKEKDIFFSDFAVDTVFFKHEDNTVLMSYEKNNGAFYLTFRGVDGQLIKDMKDNGLTLRPAGQPFKNGGAVVLPTQKCDKKYGEAILFRNVSFNNGVMISQPFEMIGIKEIREQLKIKNVSGTHTYNFNESIEVIDVVIDKFDILDFIRRVFNRIKNL